MSVLTVTMEPIALPVLIADPLADAPIPEPASALMLPLVNFVKFVMSGLIMPPPVILANRDIMEIIAVSALTVVSTGLAMMAKLGMGVVLALVISMEKPAMLA